ncbi:MAG TPA: aspartate aminotransferase family protein, partial [Armatimonadota bacterium]|nr:aspartate aminotransferase family protein [Armatimonadota bacterium]
MSNPSEWSKEQVLGAYAECVQTTYGRIPLVFVRGEGAYLWDVEGKKYLDWVSGGRAGNALGHCHPHVTEALKRQAETLPFLSNDFYHPWGARLGQLLAERSGGRKAFFCNSGTEASETAIKLARKWGKGRRGEGCFEIVTFERSFHGRTMGALSATAQTKFHKGFEPMTPGFRYVPWDDLDALAASVGPQTCAVMLEPVQGESGTYPASPSFMEGIEKLCRERDVLLMVDEIQTGFGRTGRFWAFEHYGVEPDVVTLAKALGGGVAIGACLAKPECCALAPGDHGCTFGGNPLATAAAGAAIEALEQGNCIENAAAQGEYLLGRFREWQTRWPAIRDVRGLGLMLAIEFEGSQGKAALEKCLADGLVVHGVGETTLRILPPVILTRAQADEGLAILEG